MPTLAQKRLAALESWFSRNSEGRNTPNGNETLLVGRYASIIPFDFALPPPTAFDPQALLFLVSEDQCDGMSIAEFDQRDAIDSQRDVAERLIHVLFLAEDRRLPACAIVGLTDPAEPIADAVGRARVAGVDLDSLPVLAVPLWALAQGPRDRLAARLPFAPRPDAADPDMPDDRQPLFGDAREIWS